MIILEAKAVESLTNRHVKQTQNYLAAANLKLGLPVNFGEDSLTQKWIVLWKFVLISVISVKLNY